MALDELNGMVGVWDVVTSISVNGEWVKGPSTRAAIVRDVGGRMLIERGVYEAGGRRFEPVNVYSFDPFREVFRVASLDDTMGLMDIYEGALVDGCLRLSNDRTGTWFRRPDGEERKFRLRHCLSFDAMTLEIEESPPAEDSWQPFMRIAYERAPD